MGTPIYNPGVPYDGPIYGGFPPGRMVRVQGRVNPGAHSFAINLQTGGGPYDDVAIHINPRFAENCIVRNARIGGSWGHEERQGPGMPLFRDQSFEVLISSDGGALKIAINGTHFESFFHRVQPLERVNHLRVEGDVTLTLIQVDGGPPGGGGYAPTAPPMGYAPQGGALPYPAAGGGIPQPGFAMPGGGGAPPYGSPGGAAPYPAPGGSPYSPAGGTPYGGQYPPQQPYGGYPPPAGGGGYPSPAGGGGYPPAGQPGYYQPGGPAPHGTSSGGGGGLMGNAGKLLAGGLAGVGLGKVASKIPGIGGGSHSHSGGGAYPGAGGYPGGGYPQGGAYPQGGHHGGHGSGGSGILGSILGPAAALGVGGVVANKLVGGKKHKKNKAMKYGLPIGGAVLGGYALKKGMKGFHGHGSSSSSSSSSEEE